MENEGVETPAMTRSEHDNFAEYMDQYSRKYGDAYRFELGDALAEMDSEPADGDQFVIRLKDDQFAGELQFRLDLWIKDGKKPVRRWYSHPDQVPPDR